MVPWHKREENKRRRKKAASAAGGSPIREGNVQERMAKWHEEKTAALQAKVDLAEAEWTKKRQQTQTRLAVSAFASGNNYNVDTSIPFHERSGERNIRPAFSTDPSLTLMLPCLLTRFSWCPIAAKWQEEKTLGLLAKKETELQVLMQQASSKAGPVSGASPSLLASPPPAAPSSSPGTRSPINNSSNRMPWRGGGSGSPALRATPPSVRQHRTAVAGTSAASINTSSHSGSQQSYVISSKKAVADLPTKEEMAANRVAIAESKKEAQLAAKEADAAAEAKVAAQAEQLRLEEAVAAARLHHLQVSTDEEQQMQDTLQQGAEATAVPFTDATLDAADMEFVEAGGTLTMYLQSGKKKHERYFWVSPATGIISWDKKKAKDGNHAKANKSERVLGVEAAPAIKSAREW